MTPLIVSHLEDYVFFENDELRLLYDETWLEEVEHVLDQAETAVAEATARAKLAVPNGFGPLKPSSDG